MSDQRYVPFNYGRIFKHDVNVYFVEGELQTPMATWVPQSIYSDAEIFESSNVNGSKLYVRNNRQTDKYRKFGVKQSRNKLDIFHSVTVDTLTEAWTVDLTQEYVIKMFGPNNEKLAETEAAVLLQLSESASSDNVVRLLDLFKIQGIQVNQNISFVSTDFAGDSLLDFDMQMSPFSPNTTKDLFRQLVSALIHLHSCGIAHQDISVDNIVINRASSALKLVDFECALIQPCIAGTTRRKKLWDKPVDFQCAHYGPVKYRPPELLSYTYRIRPDPTGIYFPYAKDVWAAGVVLFYLMNNGFFPFILGPISTDIFYHNLYTPPVNFYACFDEHRLANSPNLADLFSKLFALDPAMRVTAEDIPQHPWWLQG